MPTKRLIPAAALAASLLVAACDSDPAPTSRSTPGVLEIRVTEHRSSDDLLSAGLGLDGLAGKAPTPGDPAEPTAADLRRLAIYKSWTGIQSFTPAGGLGGVLGELPAVPGREFQAFATLEGAEQPVRVLVQLPDAFDQSQPCLVVAPASGSRGVYGAIALAGPWALPDGCAVAYTDKGAGTDFFDHASDTGVALDGTRQVRGAADLGFEPAAEASRDTEGDAGGGASSGKVAPVALPHVHSGDHPEADWGRHVLLAAEFGLDVLAGDFGEGMTSETVRVIAAGLSNGGGAVLRAAEQDAAGLLDAVVAVAPNITAPGAPPLFDYATAAALYQPCLLADLEAVEAMPLGNPMLAAMGEVRCASLHRSGLLEEGSADAARERLRELGFEEAALNQSAVNVVLGLWRTVGASYASAYLRRGAFDMPCGFSYSAPEASRAQRQAWWALHSGVGPGEGIVLTDRLGEGQDSQLPALRCLRELWSGEGGDARLLREAVEATRASAKLAGEVPAIVIHGADDGLIPAAFSSRPWVEGVRASGGRVGYWEVARAQHFDVLLGAPGVAGEFAPLLPYGWRALDEIRAALDGGIRPSGDRMIEPDLPPPNEPFSESDLGL